MKNTKEAVKYGIETLGVTPNEMFSLIESSRGYEGDDYKRWLANKIIEIAEKEDVGFSQLLVKKFAIIQSLAENVESNIKEEWVKYFRKRLCLENEDDTGCYSYDFEDIGEELSEDVDWGNGIDYDEVNSFFLAEQLPEIYEKVSTDKVEDLRIIAKLSSGSCSKSSELVRSAKERGINIKTEGGMFLYRMCNLVEAFNLGKEFIFGFLVNTDFLCSQDNADVMKYFEQFFDCDGVVIKSTDLFEETYISCNYAFVVCTPRVGTSGRGYGIKLHGARFNENGELINGLGKLYTRSYNPMLDVLREGQPAVSDDDIIGYLNFDVNEYHCWLSYNNEGADSYIKISKGNLSKVIIYYAVCKSLGYFGLPTNMSEVLSGHEDYQKLLYNCLPLFLFDAESKFRSEEGGSNDFDVVNSEWVKSLLNKGEVYYSYEAKELVSICKGFLDYLNEQGKDIKEFGLSFEDVRAEADHTELNSAYISALVNIKDYIKTLYRTME